MKRPLAASMRLRRTPIDIEQAQTAPAKPVPLVTPDSDVFEIEMTPAEIDALLSGT